MILIESTGVTTNEVKITTENGEELDFVKSCIINLQPDSLINAKIELCGVSLKMMIEGKQTNIKNITELNEILKQLGYKIITLKNFKNA